MSVETEQAAAVELTDRTANALVAARTALSFAAEAADDVDNVLRRTEDEISELSAQANRMYDSELPERQMAIAQEAAYGIRQRINRGHEGLEDVRGELRKASVALNAGLQTLDELEQLPGQRGEATMLLRGRLDSLAEVIQDAGRGTDRAGERLEETSVDLNRLRNQPDRVHDREEAADAIRRASRGVDEGVMDVRGGLRGLRSGLEDAEPTANAAAQESVDLAMAARAAMNPTPRSAQRVQTDGAERDLRQRTSGPAQDSDRGR
ncbi:hypothetical protein GCM10009789_60070 [Kribbella sancticallisti]|uniref:Uncharacterized protein n=1 Tax=Kribbella sancticallisti TaxID=460087 RepID=A0ABN2E9E3_9ACTN